MQKPFEEVMDSDPAYTETLLILTYYPDMVGAYPGRRFLFRIYLIGQMGMKEKRILSRITRLKQPWMNQDCSGNCLRGIMTSHCMSLIRG